MTARFFALLLAFTAVTMTACGDDDGPTPMADAGPGADSGANDAGGGMDAGPDTDAGPGDDGGGTDAGCTPTGDERTWLQCRDRIDNDCDGDTDTDVGCSRCPPAGAPESGAEGDDGSCMDGVDNDCDGFIDCSESSCVGFAACADESTDALCMDMIDNDGDGRIDCAERDCAALMVCRPAMMGMENDAATCGNGLDDDYDGRADCDDSGCNMVGFCTATEMACSDGNDNDGDGRVDCADSDCSALCATEDDDAECTNGADDDVDGRTDCEDPECLALAVCIDAETVCDDGMDEDLDGFTDCQDPDCMAACMAMPCGPMNFFGTCMGAMEVCADGMCALPLTSFSLGTDDTLLITEIQPDPDSVFDSRGEYVEVQNISGVAINVDGLVLADDAGSTMVMGRRGLGDGERLVFVADTDPSRNGGIMNGVDFGPVSLRNSGEFVSISHGGTTIHTVTWPGTGGDLSNTGSASARGQSFNLDNFFLTGGTPTARWCLTPTDMANAYNTTMMGATRTDYGTPGAANVTCM